MQIKSINDLIWFDLGIEGIKRNKKIIIIIMVRL